MNISVFGMGYVGCVTAAGLARLGHKVVGVDINRQKVDAINSGESTVLEPFLQSAIAEAHAAGRLSATMDPELAVFQSEMSFICVGTPSRSDGSFDWTALAHVAGQIGEGIATKPKPRHLVVVRSTTTPGTAENVVVPAVLDHAGAPERDAVAFAANPEFLREGSALADFFEPPFILVAAASPWAF